MPEKTENASKTNAESAESGWPWDWFYYVGTVLLGMNERTFWRTQLRKLIALWEIHKRVNGLNKDESGQEVEEVYIDQLGW